MPKCGSGSEHNDVVTANRDNVVVVPPNDGPTTCFLHLYDFENTGKFENLYDTTVMI